MQILLLLLLLIAPNLAAAAMLDWHLVAKPTKQKAQIYGSHTAGCMDGGVKLPDSGVGFVAGDVEDNRAYGQPELINYITQLGTITHDKLQRTLIIGDLASPKGGPAPIYSSLHQSHQTGLDVDIWLRAARKLENPHKLKQVSMVAASGDKINHKNWSITQVEILAEAAGFANVDRIFVNSVIKRELCRKHKGEEWLGKIRPWWGHASHFHVRLKCPSSSPECKMQQALPKGDGCDEQLAWWFTDEAKPGFAKKEPRKYPDLPKECGRVFVE